MFAYSAAGLPARADEGLRKNVVVLVDVSKSVDKTNQDSALKLVAGLITGKVDPTVRAEWGFEPGDKDLAAVGNLRKLRDGAAGEPLAADEARFVVNPLGNYARVVELRRKLDQPGTGSPQRIVAELLEPGKFAATDNSTHLTLAQAVAAEAFLKSASGGDGYYLMVISDGFEDCLNKEIKEYGDAGLLAALRKDNEGVFRGKPYQDGGGVTGHYSDADREAIRFLREETKGFDDNDRLFVGRFNYLKPVTDPTKLPVRIRIYTPMVKPSLALAESGVRKWILPDPPPTLEVRMGGVDRASMVAVTITGPGDGGSWSVVTEYHKIFSEDGLEFKRLLELKDEKPFPNVGNYAVKLAVTPGGGPPLPAVTMDIRVIKPELRLKGPKAAGTKAVGEKTIYEFPVNWEFKEGIEVEFAPGDQPAGECALEVAFDGGAAELPKPTIKGGKSSIKVPTAIAEKKAGQGEVELAVSLALPPTGEKLEQTVWLKFPQIAIWAEQAKGMTVKGRDIELPRGGRITFTANYEGCPGMKWAPTEVTGPDGKRVVAFGNSPIGERQKLDFSNAPHGNYTVKVAFGGSTPTTFTVKVPAGGLAWWLIAMGGMVVVGLSLFAWHFFRR